MNIPAAKITPHIIKLTLKNVNLFMSVVRSAPQKFERLCGRREKKLAVA